MNGVFEEQVRQRAYEIWVALGKAEGQAHEHWVAAEQDLMTPPAKPKKARAATARTKAAAVPSIDALPDAMVKRPASPRAKITEPKAAKSKAAKPKTPRSSKTTN